MAKATAVIVGATGAVGRKLTPLLAASGQYAKIIVLHRRPTPFAKLARIEERVIDFARLALLPAEAVDAIFCCIGTTQKKAGSTPAFQSVDRDIPVALACWGAANGARVLVVVSSLGADARSGSVYLRTKGEMEAGVAAAGVRCAYILRPSLLKGERDEFRLAERIGNRALSIVGPLMAGPLRKYRAVPTETVARAMLACALKAEPGVHIVESDVILDLGGAGATQLR
jgi:uncharacterized protein YbjT (DUF2867 family)